MRQKLILLFVPIMLIGLFSGFTQSSIVTAQETDDALYPADDLIIPGLGLLPNQHSIPTITDFSRTIEIDQESADTENLANPQLTMIEYGIRSIFSLIVSDYRTCTLTRSDVAHIIELASNNLQANTLKNVLALQCS